MKFRSLSIIPLLLIGLSTASVHADPTTTPPEDSSWLGVQVDVRVYGSPYWQQLLIALGIIGTGEPVPSDDGDDGDIAAFGIIGTGEPSGGD